MEYSITGQSLIIKSRFDYDLSDCRSLDCKTFQIVESYHMPQVSRVESIKTFLTAVTHADLAALYTQSMEVQVNVAQDGGTRVDGEYKGRPWQAWTDGIQTWKPIRIPYNAATKPEYDVSVAQSYDLAAHAEGIGMTGWDWENQLSRWVAFDFDHISGHKKGLTDEQLRELKEIVKSIPWVTLRKSTSGKGLHVYVMLQPYPTENHTEHAALARAILAKLSALCGFDFEAKVDVCGGNMWVWHRKMRDTDGLELVKSGDILTEIPINWKDHVKVISGRRRKTRPSFIIESDSEGEALFDDLVSQRPRIPLDDQHKKLIKYLLEDHKTGSWWDNDHWMLVTHTLHLEKAHTDLSLRGYFKTASTGSSDHNCFMFPMPRGAWSVRRYGNGVSEDDSWDQDQAGYTRCYYNRDPDLRTACRAYGGSELTNGSFRFNELEVALKAAALLGVRINLPAPWASQREAHLSSLRRDGRLVIEFDRKDTDQLGNGWNTEKGKWKKIFDVNTKPMAESESNTNIDELVRHIVTETGEDFGWVICHIETDDNRERWVTEPYQHVKIYLKSQGFNPKDCEFALGNAVARAWRLVNEPFREEYPGDRKWNRNAAQLRFIPSQNLDSLSYPSWIKMLTHCGKGLDDAVAADGWCKANAILTGADYLKAWIASLFQRPLEPLPYLFFYSPEQDTGKSVFHEAIQLLMTKGYERADAALISQSGFNGELRGAVLCVVEETDLSVVKSRQSDAYNRIKDWVTARSMPIHEKGRTPYHVPNSTHWVQCANNIHACPIFPGDTRITLCRVSPLSPDEIVPKARFLMDLEREAPDFLAAVMSLELPPAPGRLGLPVMETEEKTSVQESNRNPIETFIEEDLFRVDGAMIKYGDLWDRFKNQLKPLEAHQWTQQRFGREFGLRFPKGRSVKDSQWYFGNVSFEPLRDGEVANPKLVIEMRGINPYLVPIAK